MPPPPLGRVIRLQESAKYTLKSRNQITIKHICGMSLRYLTF